MVNKKVKTILFITLLPFFLFGCSIGFQDEEKEQHSHHSETITMELLEPGELDHLALETDFVVEILDHNHPLTEGNVGFEYWQEGDVNSQYIDAVETEAGQYSATIPFQQPGKYVVKLHLEKEEIHEHIEWMVTIEQ